MYDGHHLLRAMMLASYSSLLERGARGDLLLVLPGEQLNIWGEDAGSGQELQICISTKESLVGPAEV